MKIFGTRTQNPHQSKVLTLWRQKLNKFRRILSATLPALTSPPPGYVLIQERELADELFLRLRNSLHAGYEALAENSNPEGRVFFWESGRIDPGRPYFYIKKNNEKGWLFERSGIGWLVSRSEKIVDQSLFLRLEEPVDICTTFRTSPESGRYRVNSELMGGELISFVVYERLMYRRVFTE